MKKTLIKNGTLVTAADTFQADLLIVDGVIAALGRDLSADGAEEVDATGLYVLPGGIDVHTHFALPFGGTVASDDFYTGHRAAAFGGTTFCIDFAMQDKGESLHSAVERWHGKSNAKAVIDYSFHVGVTDLNDAVLAEIPALAVEGMPTVKLFLAYKNKLQVDDATFFSVMRTAAKHGILTMVHAENGDVIDILVKEAIAAGHLTPEWHALTRPDWAEGEATNRAAAMAAMAEAPLYVVHVTCAKSVNAIATARAAGQPVMGETCVQYFHFSIDNLRQPDGAKWVCSPPVRTASDQEALWRAVRDNDLQHISTDHCPFFMDGTRDIMYEGQPVRIAGKELGAGDFSKIPNGLPVVENRMPMVWATGVATGRISLNRLVELCCTNPARIFGLYPKKGTLAVGADADVVLWDPKADHTFSAATHHMRTDYDIYEGWKAPAMPVKVYRRGELLVDGPAWHGKPGSGAFTARKAHGEVL